MGRFSVPFFFEPGEQCLAEAVGMEGLGEGVLYGDHVRHKMGTWIEFHDEEEASIIDTEVAIEAY
jgi:hypothetical protein